MDHLEHPSLELWESRRRWFEGIGEESQGIGSYLLSEQACALTADVQAAFCAGAWVAVIILSMSVVDASLRETELPDFKGNTQQLLSVLGADAKLQKLRLRRNALTHVNPEAPAITVDEQWIDRDKLELEAREAVTLMFAAFYFNPGI